MQTGAIVAGRFEILRHAGSGGMGAVYKARDRETGQAVALKVLHGHGAAHADRFAREAQLLSELRHPGIVRFVGSGVTSEGDGFIVMEWLEGESLSARLKRGPLSVEEVIQLGVRVADALRPAHERGIVHRDLKPPNLFLEGSIVERVKVLDFGIARILDPGQKLTITGQMIGTPGYMSPEQARGEQGVDVRTDVYALGCVLYRALTGKRLFDGEDPVSALVKVTLEEPPRVSVLRPDVPPALDDLVARMLSIPKERRPGDATTVLSELSLIGGFREGATAIAPSTAQRALGPAGSFSAMQPSSFSPAPPPPGAAPASSAMSPPAMPSTFATDPTQVAGPGTHGPHASGGVAGVAGVAGVSGVAIPGSGWSGAPHTLAAGSYGQPSVGSYAPPTGPSHGYAPGPYGTQYPPPGPHPAAPGGGGNRATIFVLLGVIGALLTVVVLGLVAFLVFSPGSGGTSLPGGMTAVCPGERCIDFEVEDPTRVDAIAHLPAIRKIARGVEGTSELVMMTVITSSADGTVDLTSQRQFIQYHFQNARRDSRFYLWLNNGRLVLNRASAQPTNLPVADPSCSISAVVRASGAGGGGDTTITLMDSSPLGPVLMIASSKGSTFVDPKSCALRRLF
ncbi:serine/threonine-protein kinase [Chondromyces apiculatus]|uniref:Serine/threonine protein kinase n=1 Tax=Chondromyces apiculatus DSM 436 TaxID=1192034 RepID=A0A017TA72_9BACT|nr:serine/threonine-protein kinase [Chondromyces apiculatus]EYF06114.1 Serine/threonine protein kinase [Chondromyces apiculatus DSM 436]